MKRYKLEIIVNKSQRSAWNWKKFLSNPIASKWVHNKLGMGENNIASMNSHNVFTEEKLPGND